MSGVASRLKTAVWIGVGAAYVLPWAAPAAFLPSHGFGLRWFRTPEITATATMSQTFEMPAAGLRAIDIRAAPIGNAQGMIRLEIHDLTGHGDLVVRQDVVPAADLVRGRSYHFEFPPLVSSRNTPYRLDVASDLTSPARGIALWATRGDGYRNGEMMINDIPRWGDLAFKTYAPVPSRWRILMSMPFARRYLIVAALVVNVLLLGMVISSLDGIFDRGLEHSASRAAGNV